MRGLNGRTCGEKLGSKVSSYLDAFNPCLNPQLFHQFPGLGDIISGRHTDPSEYTNTGEN